MSRLQRILFTESSRNLGGQELQLLEQALAFARRGVAVTIACPAGSRLEGVAKGRGLPLLDVAFRNSLHPPSIQRVRRLLRAWQPQAVLSHSGHDADVSFVAARLVGGVRPRLVRVRTYQHGVPHSWTYNRLADRTVVPSEWMRAQLLANPRIDAARIAVVPPGMRFDELDARARAPLDPAVVQKLEAFPRRLVTHVAMLRADKGHLFFLDVVRALLPRYPDICYAIAGEGPMAGEIRSKVEELGLQRNVCLLGFIANPPALYARSELVVMPSGYEPLGMSQIEALALGVPVVASRVGGIPETIADGVTGLLAAPLDLADWLAAMERALGDPSAMRAMALAGKRDVRERFDLDAVLDRLTSAIEDLPPRT